MSSSSSAVASDERAHFISDPYDVPRVPVRFLRLLSRVRRTVHEIDSEGIRRLPAAARPLLIDVREFSEWQAGHAAQAVHIPRGLLEVRVEHVAPELTTSLLCYCSDGLRSALAAKSLQRLGYRHVVSLAGGFPAWEAAGLPSVGRFAWD